MGNHRFGSRTKAAFGLLVVTFIGLACHDISSPEERPQSAGIVRVAQVASANNQKTKEFRLKGGKKLVVDHGRGMLIGDDKAVRVPEEALKKIESTLTQFADLDRFFEELNANERYQACLKAGKHSTRRIVIARADSASTVSKTNSLTAGEITSVPKSLPASADPWQLVRQRSTVVEPGSCAEWVNTLSELSAALEAMQMNYLNRLGEALLAGAVFGNAWAPGWEGTVTGIATGLLQELLTIWSNLASLTLQIDVVRSMLVIGECVTQLPPVTISYNGGSGGSSGDKCTFLVITYMESYDGGQTWHVVSQRYEYRCAP